MTLFLIYFVYGIGWIAVFTKRISLPASLYAGFLLSYFLFVPYSFIDNRHLELNLKLNDPLFTTIFAFIYYPCILIVGIKLINKSIGRLRVATKINKVNSSFYSITALIIAISGLIAIYILNDQLFAIDYASYVTDREKVSNVSVARTIIINLWGSSWVLSTINEEGKMIKLLKCMRYISFFIVLVIAILGSEKNAILNLITYLVLARALTIKPRLGIDKPLQKRIKSFLNIILISASTIFFVNSYSMIRAGRSPLDINIFSIESNRVSEFISPLANVSFSNKSFLNFERIWQLFNDYFINLFPYTSGFKDPPISVLVAKDYYGARFVDGMGTGFSVFFEPVAYFGDIGILLCPLLLLYVYFVILISESIFRKVFKNITLPLVMLNVSIIYSLFLVPRTGFLAIKNYFNQLWLSIAIAILILFLNFAAKSMLPKSKKNVNSFDL